MRGAILLSGLLIIASVASSAIHTQNEASLSSSTALTADYPMDQAGVLIQSTQWTPLASQSPSKTRISRSVAASLSYGMVPAKIVAEYSGEHAPAQVETGRPVLCLCHVMSLPGDPVLVKLHEKKGARELDGGRMIVYPIVGGAKMADADKSDFIPADVLHPDPQVWLVRPQSALEPGEYALMLGTQNIIIYPFTVVAPPAHATGSN